MEAHIETERKFLIAKPDEAALQALDGCTFSDITQTYLLSANGETDRVRKREADGRAVYTRTRKKRMSSMSAIEKENEISEEEYISLLQKADISRTPIRKRRYVLPNEGFLFEIDLYPFWEKQAVMEVELPSEDADAPLPGCIRVLREVTGQYEYSNASLAKNPPEEDK